VRFKVRLIDGIGAFEVAAISGVLSSYIVCGQSHLGKFFAAVWTSGTG